MDIERARFNMVEQQIRPWNVLDQEVLDLLFVVKREEFVATAYRAMAFADLELPLLVDGKATGEVMFSPKFEARMLQSLALKKHEHVLEVGTGSGYMTALLAHRARHVITSEIHPGLARLARANLERAGIRNVVAEQRDGSRLPATGGLFDAIVLSGSVPSIPELFLQRLAPGGRLVAVTGDAPVMFAQIVTRTSDTGFTAENVFETCAPRLSGFPEPGRFHF